MNSKEMKAAARRSVRKNYLLLVLICSVSVFWGTEFTDIINNAQGLYDQLTGQITQLDTEGWHASKTGISKKIIDDLIEDNLEKGRQDSAQRMEELKATSDYNSVLGRRRGVFATIMNSLNSGHMFVMIGIGIHSLVHSGTVAAVIMILGGLTVYALVWIFVKNMYNAILHRVFMEARTYEQVPVSHLLHFKMINRWVRTSLTLLLRAVYELLWSLTIVGGLIKYYSYFLVPFIVAENPDLRPQEVILLSRRMMNGHKWECFKMQLQFIGWRLLGYLSFGAVDIFWGLPYRMATFTEYYVRLRQEAKEKNLEGAESLNDIWLYEKADEGERRKHYGEISDYEDLLDNDIVFLSPIKSFFARNFGIWLGTEMEKRVYSRQAGLRYHSRFSHAEMLGKAYPERMNPLWTRESNDLSSKANFLMPCTIWSLIIIFFTFSIVGWLWEVSLYLVENGTFVNRGVMHGPWLPIYGGGVVLIAVLLYRFREKPALEAAAIVVLCGIVEYTTSYAMEASTGMRWWDYSGYYLNLGGRICGEGLAVFALGGMAAIYLLIPILDSMLSHVSRKIIIPACVILGICFGCDFVYSRKVPNIGEGITENPASAMIWENEAEKEA